MRRAPSKLRATLLAALVSFAPVLPSYADDVTDEPAALTVPMPGMPRIYGRLYVDGQTYDHTALQLGNSLDVSSARLSLSGRLTPDWHYLIQYDFAAKSLKDAWMRYGHWHSGEFKIGNYQEPFSLEELTSSRFITFVRRALPNAFVPGYHVGAEVLRGSRLWTGAVGIFGDTVHSKTAMNGTASWATTGRVTVSPVNRPRSVVHLGMSATYRLADNTHTLTIRESPEASLHGAYLVNTNAIPGLQHFVSADLEAAVVKGPVSLQGEYMVTDVARGRGAGDLRFHGAYGYVSWFVTGESRHYAKGVFRRIRPHHRIGAIELAARYSTIDLNSGSFTGGKEANMTAGVNWYLNSHMRVMANYIKVHADTATGPESPNIFLVRFQSDF